MGKKLRSEVDFGVVKAQNCGECEHLHRYPKLDREWVCAVVEGVDFVKMSVAKEFGCSEFVCLW